ncbi:hypothetical protein [Streptomyces agglomeratus]|uniref:hypothetical protein n=1 Tax=Streptomyces agglomeratus TaxID=285458 RepID=UPI00114D1BA5|nr:hypothetical protein [Streptomyces agglomeratus]
MSLIDSKYQDAIGAGVIAASGIAIPGLFVPTLDMAGVGATWAVMIGAIAKKAGHDLSLTVTAKLAAAGVSAVSGYVLGSKLLTWAAAPLILAFPVAGVPAAVAVNATLNGLFTLRLGVACANKFSRPNFHAMDAMEFALDISGFLIKMPKKEELVLVKDLLAKF